MPTEDSERPPWHSRSLRSVLSDLETDPDAGLDGTQAASRLAAHGANELRIVERWTRLRRLGNQFQDVLVWLLIVAAVISGLLLDAWVDATAIAVIVVLNALIGYAQESRANAALDRLRDMEAPNATVVRAGTVAVVPARDVVPGDVLVVEAGDLMPADARVVWESHLVVDEAPLTGESMPVSKSEEPVAHGTVLAERTSMLHAGTTVVAGRSRAVVTSTGMSTEMGKIADLFSDSQPRTPLQLELARIGRRLAFVAGGAAILIFGAGIARSFPVETMTLTAVALAVAAIPEGLPAVITVSLAGGLQRMARRNAIVRRLPAVETLGAVDVICTDKTGTLTAPQLEVGEWWHTTGHDDLGRDHGEDGSVNWLPVTSALCNNAFRSTDGWAGDPTEVALLEALEAGGIDIDALASEYQRVDEAGFDERRKRMSTLHPSADAYVLLVKGAPEVLVSRAATMSVNGGVTTIGEPERAKLLERAEQMAERGLRTLAFAMRRLEEQPGDPAEEEKELCLLGMVGLHERIRPEVTTAVSRAARAGVRTVMVTGDHATTAAAIADTVGIGHVGLIEGRQLAKLSSEELQDTITDIRVFARVDPADKVKIIEAWQGTGAKVAMTGDGVNDAPALHRADIGIAMGSGTDVARESAAMVLTDDNYATIVEAIAEGRRLFGALRNVVHYLLSANASEVIFVLVGFLAFGFMGEPLLAVQLLWINLISDAMPAIALGMEGPTRDLMSDPPGVGRDVLSGPNTIVLLTQGVILAAAAVLVLLVGTFVLDLDHSSVQTMVFSTLVFSQLLHALSIRARAGTSGRRPGPLMMGAVLGSAVLHMVVVYTEPGNTFFRTLPLDFVAMGWTIGASVLSMVLVRLFNRVVDRRKTVPAAVS